MYSALEKKLSLTKGIPFTPDWSAAADFIQLIVDHALTAKPEIIVECSSGLTTLMIARCCQMNGHGHIYSLENGLEYAEKTRSYFERYGLNEYATVIDAPLDEVMINDNSYQWYNTDELLDLLKNQLIDMLMIDGPPGFMQKNSRYPAVPILFNQLADKSKIFLDDAARDDEHKIVELWQSEFPELAHQYIDLERGCSVLMKDSS